MRVFRLHPCNKEILSLNKKYRTVDDDVGYVETLLLNDGHLPADPYPGLQFRRDGESVRVLKARVLVRQLGGKSSGLRLLYEVLDAQGIQCSTLLHTYVHAQNISEKDVRTTVLERLGMYEATLESIAAVSIEIRE
jgi:hypothetical protein